MIISRTPVRISFFGGGTDYREYYSRHPGAVLGTTLNKYVYVSLNRLSDFFNYKIRVGYSKSELVNNIDDIVHPSVRECLKLKNIHGNLDIHIFADLPARTGLGSSSAFTVGFLNALYALDGKLISKQKLAEEATHVEQNLIKENVGSQDQFHAAYGGLNIIEFNSNGIQVKPIIISQEKRKLLEDSIMLFYTGQERHASETLKEQVKNTVSQSKDHYLKRMYEMVYEAQTIISSSPTETMVDQLGTLLHESWGYKKNLSSKITNSTIDNAYQAARAAGAHGGKLCGAGNGGFLLFLVNPSKQSSVRTALKNLLEVKFGFESEGSSIIYLKDS